VDYVLIIWKGAVVFLRIGSVGLSAKSPKKNRGMPLPSRLGTKDFEKGKNTPPFRHPSKIGELPLKVFMRIVYAFCIPLF